MGMACKGTTKAGKPCKAPPLKAGTVIADVEVSGDYCRAHDPTLPASAHLSTLAEGHRNGRKPKAKPTEVLRLKVEAEIEKWLKPYEDALTADQGVVVGTGPQARLEVLPDHKTRMAAATAVFDRIYGKPRQAHELTGAEGETLQVFDPREQNAEWTERVEGVVEKALAARGSSEE